MSAVRDNNGTDQSIGENHQSLWDEGKKHQNSAKCQVQELEEAEEFERKAVEARTAAQAALSPEEREKRKKAEEADSLALAQRLQEYKYETRCRITQYGGSACPVSVRTPGPEEDVEEEMDVDCPEENHPETSHVDQIQEWLTRLEPGVIAQSEDAGDMEVDRPSEFGLFLQLTPDLILVPIAVEPEPKEEGLSKEEMLARLAGQRAEKAREEELEKAKITEQRVANEAEAAWIEAQMAELQSKHDALTENLAVKMELLPVEVPAQAQLLEDAPSGFWSMLQPDGRVAFVLDDDNNEPVASGSGARPDPELKKD
ncbi:hypothetical protein DFH08DRAFT_820094 [Mycena albidolilacea]|uniref:Uncharacterized protein n=1 Tax=Mycena albidolilacea TaxID=1033008 RepID=A0AAD6ZDI9_9AGAR|nr:hypothetical protein DFH08DRAFT_820094 [Mycena albidolilacea]